MRSALTYIGILLLLFAAIDTTAQTAAAELEKVALSYHSAQHLSMEANVRVYTSKADKTGNFLGKGVMRKSKGNYYSRFLNDEMIINNRCVLVIDHAQKTIEFYETLKNRKRDAAKYMPDVKAIMGANDSIRYNGVKSGMKCFTFYNERSPITRTELCVNAATGFIEKIEYYYTQDDAEESYDAYKVVVEYRNISTKNPGEEIFSEKKYVMHKSGNTVPAPSYKNYQLIAEDK